MRGARLPRSLHLLFDKLLLPLPHLFILDLAPVLGFGFVAVRLAAAAGEGGTAGVQLVALVRAVGIGHGLVGDREVAAEAFAHVDHAALAFAEALLELLALGREGLDEGGSEAVGCAVAMDHDAV